MNGSSFGENHILKQIQDYYTEGSNFLRSRKQRQVKQLILFNNLQRGDQNIASTTLFSLFNRVHSTLYSDVITVKFISTETADYRKTEVLNKLQQNDYREMEKWTLDYDWLWNAAFYGDGFVETLRWSKDRKIMLPEVINNLVMIYDPHFAEIKNWRYYGYWIVKSEIELKKIYKAGILQKDFDLSSLPSGMDTEIWSYKVQHDQARMATGVAEDTSNISNRIYYIFEIKMYDENGNKCLYWVDKNFSKILRKTYLDLDEDESWPLVRKQIFREPNSSFSISIPDILEDKHRAKNVLMNLMYIAAKDEANPIYEYNPDLVKDITQMFQRQIEHHVPVERIGESIKRLNLGPAVSNSLLQFISLLNNESTDAVGTTMVQPILPRGKKSATGEALAQQVADLIAALQSKIIGIGEKDFWSKWYLMHLKHLDESEEKAITLTNVATGVTINEVITKEDIKTKFPPKIEILSQREADYKELVKRRDLMQIFPILMKNMDKKGMEGFMKFVFFPLFIKDTSTIDRILPKSLDEIKAYRENDLLIIDQLPDIHPEDDDDTHLYVHYQAEKTSATWSHIFAHEEQRAVKKSRQEEQQKQQGQQQFDKISNRTANMTEAAVPLGQETSDYLAQGRSVLAR